MSWEAVTLADIAASIQTGPFGSQLHQSDYSEVGIPVVMPKDLIDGHISEESIARVDESHVQRLSRHKIENGDILYSRRGDVGRCAFAGEKEQGWLCGTGCLRVTIDSTKANSRFIFYQLQKPETVGWVINHAVGATMLNLNTSILGGIPLSIPSLIQQNRIVDILTAYDSLIETNQRQIKLLEEAAQRLYREWFVDLRFPGYENVPVVDGVPEGWKRESVGTLCTKTKEIVAPESIPAGTPYIGLEHIPRHDFCLSEWGDSTDVTSLKAKYAENDIIFGQIRPYFHKVGFALNDGVASTDSFIMTPRADIWGLFLLTVFSGAFVSYTYQTCKEGAKMPRADWNEMKKYPILVADNHTQALFEERIDSIAGKVRSLALQNRLLSEARDRLLPKLMSGEIAV